MEIENSVVEADSLKKLFKDSKTMFDSDKRYMALHNLEIVL